MNHYKHALQLLNTALHAVSPEVLIQQQVSRNNNRLRIRHHDIDLFDFQRVFLIGFGKASGYLAAALEPILSDYLTAGLVIVPYGYMANCRKVIQREAGHPLPDENGLYATAELVKIARKAGKKDLVICLISGGGSALLAQYPPHVGLKAMQVTTDLLLKSGANIQELNIVRKHLSLVKGGKLAKIIAPAECYNLIISDVIGDRLDTIASGPTAPDTSTFSDARAVIEKYRLGNSLPPEVSEALETQSAGETLKADAPVFYRQYHIILGNNLTALIAAKQQARQLGYFPHLLSRNLRGESRYAAQVIAATVKQIISNGHPIRPPACLLFGGETTVTVTGSGLGGRNQEFVLSALIELSDLDYPFALLSCGSDGKDGPTDAAGAIITESSREKASLAGLHPHEFLANNDAYHFFQKIEGLIKTGPTGTNVMDIGIALIA